eukprot:7979310-Lingulodinium_polyedra.AAC.1
MSYPGSRDIEYWAFVCRYEQLVRGIQEFEELADKFMRMCARDDRRHDNGEQSTAVNGSSEDVEGKEP